MPLAMSTTTLNRTERRKFERATLKQQQKSRASAALPQPKAPRWRWTIAFCALFFVITASVFAISSPTVRSWFKRPTPLQIAPNQAAINLDDGGLVYSTDNRITAFHGSDPRHRQLIGLRYTVGSVDDTDYHPLLWRSVDMSLKKPDGSVAEVSATRPLWWFEITKAKEGETVALNIHEAGISGMATVHKTKSLADKPFEPPTPGYHPVIATIKHLNAKVIELTFQGEESEPLGVTPNHPLWSEDRSEWIPAGELRIGEMVATTKASARLLRRQAKPGLHTVHNIEVHRTHAYHVGKLGLMAHNTGIDCQALFSIYHQFRSMNNKLPEEAWRLMEALYVKPGGKGIGKVSDLAFGNALEDLLRKDVFSDPVLKLWTQGNRSSPGHNMWMHYRDHVLSNKPGIPGGEFPNITNAVDYVKAARQLVNPTGPVNVPGGTLLSWAQGSDKTVYLDLATKRFGVKVNATGEVATFFVSNEKNNAGSFIGLLQWARNHGYPNTTFP